ncbi:hypothetical protein [Ornithinibacillus californiensis]|nr:hypothetical protein [Ornithinibacillus californiensis]
MDLSISQFVMEAPILFIVTIVSFSISILLKNTPSPPTNHQE